MTWTEPQRAFQRGSWVSGSFQVQAECCPAEVGMWKVPRLHFCSGPCIQPRSSQSPPALPGRGGGIYIIPCLENAHLVLEQTHWGECLCQGIHLLRETDCLQPCTGVYDRKPRRTNILFKFWETACNYLSWELARTPGAIVLQEQKMKNVRE